MNKQLPVTQELDFHYLLGLMPPLHDVPEFAWLPELFSTIGYESLIKLCRFAGGESIRLPELEQLLDSIEALQWFYDIDISKKRTDDELPLEYQNLVYKIRKIYNAEKR